MQFTVRNSTATPGWIVDLGMRVSSRPVRFGETSYLVKNGTEHIEFIQAPDRGRNLNIESPSDGQKVILDRLVECGVIIAARRDSHVR